MAFSSPRKISKIEKLVSLEIIIENYPMNKFSKKIPRLLVFSSLKTQNDPAIPARIVFSKS